MASDLGSGDPDFESLVQRHGEFTAMCIHLGNGLYTRTPPCADRRLHRLVQMIADLSAKPLARLRVADLACLEGHYAAELALHGAEVVGIELRLPSIEKARYVKRRLGLRNLHLHQEDVRDFRREKYGTFDVVLCAGILYHLDAPDMFRFVEQVYSCCDRLAIFDTFISLRDRVSVNWRGRRYSGLHYREHESSATKEEKLAKLWSSADNNQSFWLTHSSFCNLIMHTGFSSLYECLNPHMPHRKVDRRTYVAVKRPRVAILSSPLTEAEPEAEWPERARLRCHRTQRPPGVIRRAAKAVLPQPLKSIVKRTLRAIGVLPHDVGPAWRRKATAAKHVRLRRTDASRGKECDNGQQDRGCRDRPERG